MKKFVLLVLLVGLFSLTAVSASSFCEMKTDYLDGVGCASGTVVVENDEELDAYLEDFGFTGSRYKNLKIKYDVTRPVIEVHSPCKITLHNDVVLTGESVCLDGRRGVVDDNGYEIHATDVAVMSEQDSAGFGAGSFVSAENVFVDAFKTAKIGHNSVIDATGFVEIVSSGDLGSSDAIVKSGSAVNAGSFLIESQHSATVGQNVLLNVAGDVSVISTGDFGDSNALIKAGSLVNSESLYVEASRLAKIGQNVDVLASEVSIVSTGDYSGSRAEVLSGSSVLADSLDVSSGNKAKLSQNVFVLVSGNFNMDAAASGKCSIANSATIDAGSTTGICLA